MAARVLGDESRIFGSVDGWRVQWSASTEHEGESFPLAWWKVTQHQRRPLGAHPDDLSLGVGGEWGGAVFAEGGFHPPHGRHLAVTALTEPAARHRRVRSEVGAGHRVGGEQPFPDPVDDRVAELDVDVK